MTVHAAAGDDASASHAFGFQSMIGQSRLLRQAVEMAERVAASRRTTVLILGETGTGKELIARGIHYTGEAASEPFVAINCAAIPEALLESELFGHERGAFTGAHARKKGLLELAGGGTVFLDEIHHLPLGLQPKLLRALESRMVRRLGGFEEFAIDCRIVAAAGPLLEQVVAAGEFREDLFYRLNVFTIGLPPLRERPEDIDAIARHFLAGDSRDGTPAKTFTPDALAALHLHRWPGNVRELKNVVERAVILAGPASAITTEHLMIQRRSTRPSNVAHASDQIAIPGEGKSLARIEAEAVEITMRLTGGNQTAAARLLGISRPTLAKKLASVRLASV